MHVIAAKAVAFGEALRPEFKEYSKRVVENAQVLAETLKGRGFDIVSGGTDTHVILVDLRPKGLKGDADQDGDEAITMEEIQSYVTDEVSFMARKLNSREQTPQLRTNDETKVMVNY